MTLTTRTVIALFANLLLGLSSMHGCRENRLPAGASMTMVQPEELEGEWGGSGVLLIFGSDGGQINYDCAHGTISGPIRVDSKGIFHADGTHIVEKPGPIRLDEKLEEVPVRYEGDLKDDELELTVTRSENGENLGRYLLFKGSRGQLNKCR